MLKKNKASFSLAMSTLPIKTAQIWVFKAYTNNGTRSKSTRVKIHPRSKSIQSNLRTAYQSRVRGNSGSKK